MQDQFHVILKPTLVKNEDNTTTCRESQKVLFPPNTKEEKSNMCKYYYMCLMERSVHNVLLFLFSCISFLQNVTFNQCLYY